jgi:hypothetical protein
MGTAGRTTAFNRGRINRQEGFIMNPKPFMKHPDAFASRTKKQDMFEEFDATQLYCPKCQQAVSVRKRLLLVLPEGDKYEYLCAFCSTSVGTKIDRQQQPVSVIV